MKKRIIAAIKNSAVSILFCATVMGGFSAIMLTPVSKPWMAEPLTVELPATAPPTMPPVVIVTPSPKPPQSIVLTVEPSPTQAKTPTPTPEPQLTLLGRYKVVGYNFTDAAQCGKEVANGITASGEVAVHGKTAAMEGVPFGTEIYIDGYGTVTINDRGVTGNMIDVAFDNNSDCFAITGWYECYLIGKST